MKAFIITLFDNPLSVAAARNCYASAMANGYDVQYFEASTGSTGRQLLREEGIQPITITGKADSVILRHQKDWVGQSGTLGCFASHYRLWQLTVEVGEPIVIFEHDALVLAPFPTLDWHDVLYMQCEGDLKRLGADYARDDQMETGVGIYRMGFRPAELPHLVCMPCCHAYCIKPHAAQSMIDDVRANGWFAVDRAMREPVVAIETHNPSLATLQQEYMHISSTTSRVYQNKRAVGYYLAHLRRRLRISMIGDG